MPNRCSQKIAFFLPSLAAGGAERVTLNLAEGLSKMGFDVEILLSKAHGDLLQEVPGAVNLIDFDCDHTVFSLPKLVRYMRQVKPKVIISAIDHANVVSILAQKLSGQKMKTLITLHTNISSAIKNKRSNNIKRTILPHLIRFTYPQAGAIIAVSKGVAKDFSSFLSLPSEDIEVIYNPVINNSFYSKSLEEINHPWFLPGSPPVILSLGRLAEPKDFNTLIKAFGLVRKRKRAHLMILGEGEDRGELERLVAHLGLSEEVQFPGFVRNPYPFLRKASVFVLSSKTEGLPTVLIEALALGIPIVSSDCESGPREILGDGDFGRLVPVGDEKKMAEEINFILDDKRIDLNNVEDWKESREQLFAFNTAVDRYTSTILKLSKI